MFEIASPDVSTMLQRADAAARDALIALSGRPPGPWGTIALEAGVLEGDAKSLARTSELLRRMPLFRAAVQAGLCSASQAKGISRELRSVRGRDLSPIDDFIGKRAPKLRDAEPDRLVYEVGVYASTVRNDLMQAREERARRSSFLSMQPRLDGGEALYGEADSESFASICEAIDAAALAPSAETSRAHQRMEALVGICERSLVGDADKPRPRPRVLVTVDTARQSAFLHTRVKTRPQQLSVAATDALLCDADLLGVRFENERPVSVSGVTSTVPERARIAVAARDGGCRFPGCHAPIAWSDCHHITLRSAGGGHEIDNLVLLCRTHHGLVHAKPWAIMHRPNGAIEFRYRGKSFTSYPRARFPALE